MSRTIRVWLIEVRRCTGEGSFSRYSRGIYGRRKKKLPVSVSYSAVKMLLNESCRRHSVFTVRA